MFTGREYDSETGLYYYRARYYSPGLGRFLQRDPVGYSAGINLYTYCYNNPIKFIDPSGNIANIIIGAGVGALGGFIRGVIRGETGRNLWISVGGGAVVGAVAGASFGGSLLVGGSALSIVDASLVTGATAFTVSSISQGLKGETDTKKILKAAAGEALIISLTTSVFAGIASLAEDVAYAVSPSFGYSSGKAVAAGLGLTLREVQGLFEYDPKSEVVIVNGEITEIKNITKIATYKK